MTFLSTTITPALSAGTTDPSVPVLIGLTDGVGIAGTTVGALILGQMAAGTIQWSLDGAVLAGETGPTLTLPQVSGSLSVRVNGVESATYPIRIAHQPGLSWPGAVLSPGDTLTLTLDGAAATAGEVELLRNGGPIAAPGGQYHVQPEDLGAVLQARQSDFAANRSAAVPVARTPAPDLQNDPGTSGNIAAGQTHIAGSGDQWLSDGEVAVITHREYRFDIDGVAGAAQEDRVLVIPADAVGQVLQPQLRARTATSPFSQWRNIGSSFTALAATPTPDIHVDATLGDDTADGTAAQPFQTLARAAAAAQAIGPGVRIGLAAGSVWRETFDLANLAFVTVEATGNPALDGMPFINAADPLSGFQDHAARGDTLDHVYTLSHSHEAPAGQAAGGPSVYEDGEMLQWVPDRATCQTTPGSFTHDGVESGTSPVTLSIHPTGSGDPATNGHSYDASARIWALRLGDDASVRQLRAANQLHDNGAIHFGHRGFVDSCLVHGSPIHDALGASGEYFNTQAWHPHSDARTGAIALEFYTDTPYAGMSGAWRDCIVTGPPDTALPRASSLDGFGGHTNGSGPDYVWTVEDCALFGCDMIPNDVSELTVTRLSIRNGRASFAPTTQATDMSIVIDRSFEAGNDIGLDAALWAGGTADGLRLSVPADFNAALKDSAGGQLTRSVIHLNTGADGQASGAARCVRLTGNGDAIGITGSILYAGAGVGNNLVQTVDTVTLANDDNVLWELADGTKYFLPDGTAKGNLAAVQAEGLELNSIEVDPQIADPLAGDWTVSGAVGARGLERPAIAYRAAPTSLAEAEAQILNASTPPTISGFPTLSGPEQAGETLVALAAPVSGLSTRRWQWRRDGADIVGATEDTYLLQSADEGRIVTVVQIEENAFGLASAESAPTGPIAVNPPSLSAPVVAADGPNAITWSVTSDEAGGTIFAAARLSTDPLLSPSEIQNGSGFAAAASSDPTPTADAANGGTITGLPQNTEYVVDLYHRDTDSHESAVISSGPTTTDMAPETIPPSVVAVALGAQEPDGDVPITVTALSEDAPNSFVIGTLTAQTGLSAAHVIAGTDTTGAPAPIAAGLDLPVAVATAHVPIPTDLDAVHHLYLVLGDSWLNYSDPIALGPVGIDTTAPVLSAPVAQASGATAVDWSVTSETGAGEIFAAIRPAGAAPLSAADIEAGTGGAVAIGHDTTPVAGAGNGGTIAGLAPETDYAIDMVQRDAVGNESAVVSSAVFTTAVASSAAPTELQHIAFDSTASATGQFETPALTIGAASDRMLVACLALIDTANAPDFDAVSATFGAVGRSAGTGVAMTRLALVEGGRRPELAVFALPAPASGAGSVQFSIGAALSDALGGWMIEASGVDQTLANLRLGTGQAGTSVTALSSEIETTKANSLCYNALAIRSGDWRTELNVSGDNLSVDALSTGTTANSDLTAALGRHIQTVPGPTSGGWSWTTAQDAVLIRFALEAV